MSNNKPEQSSQTKRPGQKVTYNSRSKPPRGFNLIEGKLNDFKAKLREAEAESSEYKRKAEILWPILRLNHQRSRYVFQMLANKRISQDVMDYCLQLGLIDSALISFWKKPGYEFLCCIECSQQSSQYGTSCICRVPANQLANMPPFECKSCGCRGCSGMRKPTSSTTQPQQQQQKTKTQSTDTSSQQPTNQQQQSNTRNDNNDESKNE